MEEEENIPKDKFHFVFVVFFLLGIGNLMPWNFFINVQEYWDYKFRGINHLCHLNQNITNCQSDHSSIDINIDGIDHKPLTPLQIQWNSYLSIASTIPQVIVLMLNAIFGHKISTKLKILTSLIGIVVLFLLTDIMTQINTDNYQNGFLILTLTTAVFISCFIALLQGSLAALAGLFPATYMGSLFQGHAIGGIITAVLNIISIASTNGKSSSPSESAFLCFLAATIFTIFVTLAFVGMASTDFYKYYTTRREINQNDIQFNDELENISESPYLETPSAATSKRNVEKEDCDMKIRELIANDVSSRNGAEDMRSSSPVYNVESNPLIDRENNNVDEANILDIVHKIWLWVGSIFITYVVCLTIFPSIAALVDSTEKGEGHPWNDKFFTPVGCFLLFNFGDYVGILVASLIKWPKATKSGSLALFIVSMLRLLYIPLFLFCNASPNNRSVTNVYIASDEIFLLLLASMSISNGYIGSIVMMYGPKMLNNPEDQSRAASMLCFFLVLGVSVGALLSAPILRLL